MEKESISQIEIAIAEVNHNLECVIEAQEQAEADIKKHFTQEKRRLTKLLNELIKIRDKEK